MPAIDSATGVNNSAVVVGQNLTDTVTASSTATAAATTVDGIATGNAVSTQDVGVLDSTLNVGGNGTLTVNETGVVTGSATTVNAVNATPFLAVPSFISPTFTRGAADTAAMANGDQILVTNGTVITPYYVTNYTAAGGAGAARAAGARVPQPRAPSPRRRLSSGGRGGCLLLL